MKFQCPQCGLELNLSEHKLQGRALNVRCSRCQQAIVLLPAGAAPAPKDPAAESSGSIAELSTVLKDFVRTAASTSPAPMADKQAGSRRRLFLCLGNPKLREELTAAFNGNGYDVASIEDIHHGLAGLQDSKVDVLILDPTFALEERGYETLMRYVSDLAPRARRHLFVVLLCPQHKTLDRHAAFVEQVNLVVNMRNTAAIQPILERSIREFNDFYRAFNQTAGRAPI